MRYFIILLSILTTALNAQCYTFTTYEPQNQAVNSIQPGYSSYPKITKIEDILLNKSYENENINTRLERLEKKVFKKTFSSADLSWRVENLMANVDAAALYGISSKELNQIEKKVLGKTYSSDNLENRLSRIEQQVFGAMQGGKIDERFETLRTAATHYNNLASTSPFDTNYNNVTGTSGGIKGALQNVFGSFFNSSNYMTGYTPPISSYGAPYPYGFNPAYNPAYQNYQSPYRCYNSGYNSAYTNPYRSYSAYGAPYGYGFGYGNSGINRSIRTNTGYYNSHRTAGSGCGIHILD